MNRKPILLFVPVQIRFLIMLSMSVMILNCDQNNNTAYQAIVSAEHTGTPGAVIDGIPTYHSVTEALTAAPAENKTPFVIYIRNGSYHEKLSVDKSNIHLIGESRDETIITYDATGESVSPEGEPYGTWGCFTIRISAPGFRAENLHLKTVLTTRVMQKSLMMILLRSEIHKQLL